MMVKTEWNYFKTILTEIPIKDEKINRYLKLLKKNRLVTEIYDLKQNNKFNKSQIKQTSN